MTKTIKKVKKEITIMQIYIIKNKFQFYKKIKKFI